MKTTVIAYGSREEVEPIVALALGLLKEGNEVLFISNVTHKDLCAQYGLRFGNGHPIDPTLLFEGGAAFVSAGDSKGFLWYKTNEFHKAFAHIDQATLGCIKRATDVLICNPGSTPLGMAVARRLKLPFIAIHPSPETPTREWPYLPMGWGKGMLGMTNMWSYSSAQQMIWGILKKTITGWHKCRVGVPVIADGWLNLSLISQQDVPVIVGIGAPVIPRPEDWGRWVHSSGVWALDAPATWTPPPQLASFLASGPEPVYIGFGDCAAIDVESYAALAIEALEELGLRGIVHSQWKGFQSVPLRRPRSSRKKRMCNIGGA